MPLYTKGIHYYPDYEMPITVLHHPEDAFNKLMSSSQDCADTYKIVFLSQGCYHLELNNTDHFLSGPHLIFLNNEDHCFFLDAAQHPVDTLIFHPSILNCDFDLYSCDHPDTFPVPQLQNLYYFSLFKHTLANQDKIRATSNTAMLNIRKKLLYIDEQLTDQASYFWPCRARGCLIELLAPMTMPSVPLNASYDENSSLPLVAKVIQYLENHYAEKNNLDELSRHFQTNRTTLINAFNKTTALSPYHYLQQIRLDMACSLLRNTELPIDEITERTGFTDLSYFSKVFKKEIHYTPAEYRKKNTNLNCG